jgi:hypothetical protein
MPRSGWWGLAPVAQSIRRGFDSRSVVRDVLLGIPEWRDVGRIFRFGRADAVHEQITTVRFHDCLEPLDGVEQVARCFVAVSRVDRNPPFPQPILRLLTGPVLLFTAVRIERPLPFLETVGHGRSAGIAAAAIRLPPCAASAISLACRCHSLIASCNGPGLSTGRPSPMETSIVSSPERRFQVASAESSSSSLPTWLARDGGA